LPVTIPTLRNAAPASSGRSKSQTKDRNMRRLKLRDGNSALLLTVVALSALILPGCNVKVNKDSEGQEKKVDIETPIGGLHVSKAPDVRDTGLPVYPGARRKQEDEGGNSNGANVNISSSLFGLRVVAVEYLSDDSPSHSAAWIHWESSSGSMLAPARFCWCGIEHAPYFFS